MIKCFYKFMIALFIFLLFHVILNAQVVCGANFQSQARMRWLNRHCVLCRHYWARGILHSRMPPSPTWIQEIWAWAKCSRPYAVVSQKTCTGQKPCSFLCINTLLHVLTHSRLTKFLNNLTVKIQPYFVQMQDQHQKLSQIMFSSKNNLLLLWASCGFLSE